jgi:hypothetical protein
MKTEIMSPQEVFEHHIKAFGENDIEAVMSDFLEDSILITPDAIYKGLSEIKSFFSDVIPHFPTEGTVIEVDKMHTESNIIYIIWHGTTPSLDVPFATDTFVIEDGKIKIQTFAAIMNPVESAN